MSIRPGQSRNYGPAMASTPARPVIQGAQQNDPLQVSPAVSRQLERLGLFWCIGGEGNATSPFSSSGATVAAMAFVRALASYGNMANVDIFLPITRFGPCQEQLKKSFSRQNGADAINVSCCTESDIPSRLQMHEYDVLHDPCGIDFTQPSYVRSRLARRVVPVTCSQYGISYSFQLYASFVRLLTAQIYPCDAIVCSSIASRRAMTERLTDLAERYSRGWNHPALPLPRLELIPWGVDTERFAPRDQARARLDLDLPLDRPIILCIGRMRIHDKMDWTPLLLCFARLTQMVKNHPILVLAGSNPTDYGQQLLSQASQLGLRDSIQTFFNLPPASLASLYAACDVFVSPVDSPSESFGLTIVEAMASGRPVVASDWDGYRELILHGDSGFRVRTDWIDCLGEVNELAPFLSWEQEHLHVGQSVSVDVGQMAGYLARLLEDRELREKMGRQGRARAEELYAWPVIVAQWEALWNELQAIAFSIKEKVADRFDYLQPNYFRHFCHYASRIVDEETLVALTPRGREVLSGCTPLLLHPWAQGFLHPRYMHATLSILKPTRWVEASLKIGDLVHILRKRFGLSRDRSLMHLMWMTKYDLLALGGDELGSEGLLRE